MKCPYCGSDNAEKAVIYSHCYAGLPKEKTKSEEQEKPEQKNALRKRTRS